MKHDLEYELKMRNHHGIEPTTYDCFFIAFPDAVTKKVHDQPGYNKTTFTKTRRATLGPEAGVHTCYNI